MAKLLCHVKGKYNLSSVKIQNLDHHVAQTRRYLSSPVFSTQSNFLKALERPKVCRFPNPAKKIGHMCIGKDYGTRSCFDAISSVCSP